MVWIMMRCEQLVNKNRPTFVLGSYGCGTFCRIYNKQISMPESLDHGWLRVHVYSSFWLGKINIKTNSLSWFNEGFRNGPGSKKSFWFAQCDKGLFGSGQSPKSSEANIRSVYVQSGKYKGQPRRASADADIYERWIHLCKYQNYADSVEESSSDGQSLIF